MPDFSEPIGPYAALKIRDFRFFVIGRFLVTLAIQVQAIAVSWQVYEITKDPLSLGLIGLAEAIPSLAVSLYAGHIADIIDRKKIILACILVLFLCSLSLLAITLQGGSFIALYGVAPIYMVIFISGIARGFISPALFALMPQLVPRNLYKNAITWNSAFWETAVIVGLALGGFLYGFIGITVTYALDAGITFLGLIFAFLVSQKPMPPVTDEQGTQEKIMSGLRFVFKNQIILSAISLDLFAVLFGGAVALLPIFADEILHIGAQGLGILRAAPSIGALVMAFYITHYPIQKNIGIKMLLNVAGFGVCMILFALSTNFMVSLMLLVLSGAFDCVSVIIRSTLIQTLTPENMKGRVSAVNHIFVGSSNEIGMFESGLVARMMGVVPSVIFGGFMTLAVVGVTAVKAKKLTQLQRLD